MLWISEAGMSYDEDLDTMIRAVVEKDEMVRKKMFGGTCYLMDGKMVCGAWKGFMILRLGEAEAGKALAAGRGRVFDITGKPMKGWIMIERNALTAVSIEAWIEAAKGFVRTIEG
jgi:hypothetical protein